MSILSEHARQRLILAGAIVFFAVASAAAVYMKFGAPESDHQRLNALEARVGALEEERIIIIEPLE